MKLTLIRILVFAGFLTGGSQVFAQTHYERMALIDSLSNPSVVKGAEVMRFEKIRIDAGEMNEDSTPSEYIYRWTNEGTTPLSVFSVQTTCGCAAPSFDRSPVLPGESGELKITYHPQGHPGHFLRKIFVYTSLSSDKPTAVLELCGEVNSSVLPTDDYPVAMGDLLLKRGSVTFEGNSRQTERIECFNAGDKVLNISIDAKVLPSGVTFETTTLAPGQTADLVLRFDPAKVKKRPKSSPVFLKGINLPPTQCMITVKFE